MQTYSNTESRAEQGFMLVEIMVALVLLAVVGLAVAKNSVLSMITLKRGIRNSISAQLAIEKLEQLGSVDPTTLSSGSSTNETNLVVDDISFHRTATVTVNTDSSVSVTVTVVPNDDDLGTSRTVSSRFPLWGNK